MKKLLKKIKMLLFSKMRYKFATKNWFNISDIDDLSRALETRRFTETLEPLVMSGPDGKNILVLAPHPDDEALGPGGTLLKMAGKNKNIKIIIFSSGETSNGNMNRNKGRRERESLKAANIIGARIEFLGLAQKEIISNSVVIQKIKSIIKEFNPDTVLIPFFADDHPDHRAVNLAFLKALKDHPSSVEIWAYQVYSTCLPNVLVDISKVIKKKLSLIRCYKSQLGRRDWVHYIRGLNAINSRYLKTNKKKYAETFFVLPSGEYLKILKKYFMSRKNSPHKTVHKVKKTR